MYRLSWYSSAANVFVFGCVCALFFLIFGFRRLSCCCKRIQKNTRWPNKTDDGPRTNGDDEKHNIPSFVRCVCVWMCLRWVKRAIQECWCADVCNIWLSFYLASDECVLVVAYTTLHTTQTRERQTDKKHPVQVWHLCSLLEQLFVEALLAPEFSTKIFLYLFRVNPNRSFLSQTPRSSSFTMSLYRLNNTTTHTPHPLLSLLRFRLLFITDYWLRFGYVYALYSIVLRRHCVEHVWLLPSTQTIFHSIGIESLTCAHHLLTHMNENCFTLCE